jgi:hypothetical protein
MFFMFLFHPLDLCYEALQLLFSNKKHRFFQIDVF